MPDENKEQQQEQQTQQPFNLSAALATPDGRAAIDAYVAEETRGLRGALDEHKTFKSKYLISKDGDPVEYLDPDKAKGALHAPNGDAKKPKTETVTEDQIKAAVKTAKNKFETDTLKPIQTALEAEQTYTRRLLITNEVRDSLSKAGIHQHLMDGLMALWEQQGRFSVETENDNRVVVVRKDDGATDYGSTGRKTIPEFVDDFKASDMGKSYFLASTSTGGHTGSPRAAPSGNKVRSKMTAKDKTAYIGEHGLKAFLDLP